MQKGFIKYYCTSRGFGFVVDNESKTSIFFHHTNCLDLIKTSMEVEFLTKIGKKGLEAVEIRKAKRDNGKG